MKIATKPRMAIEITKEQKDKLNKYLAYGEQRRVFSTILDDVISMLDEFGHAFVVFILEREFSYRVQMKEYYANRQHDYSSSSKHATRTTTRTDSPNPDETASTT